MGQKYHYLEGPEQGSSESARPAGWRLWRPRVEHGLSRIEKRVSRRCQKGVQKKVISEGRINVNSRVRIDSDRQS